MEIDFTTAGGLPSDGTAEAAVVNLTGVAGSASTYLSLFPTNSSGAVPIRTRPFTELLDDQSRGRARCRRTV